MKVVIAGGTGLLGKRLQKLLKDLHAEVIILSTTEEERIENGIHYVKWMNGAIPVELFERADAFINLAGVSLNEGRWSKIQKEKILKSRLDTTSEIIRIFELLQVKPKVFINASAIGIYEPSVSTVYKEDSKTKSSDFLSSVVEQWEATAAKAQNLSVRTCLMRFGVILEKNDGALPMMLLPYKLFVGGTIGSGEQWVSWIHAEDAARAILFTIQNKQLNGPINTVSPNAKRMKQFGKTIAKTFNRPHFFPVPSVILKMTLGEKSMLVLKGQYVVPQKLLQADFQFKYPSLENALLNLYNSNNIAQP